MSKRVGALYHPTNKEPVDIYSGFNWPCLFFGPIWFAVKNMWLWAVASLGLVAVSGGLSMFVFPFFANSMHKKHLRSSGYLTEDQAGLHPAATQQPVSTTFTSPLAAVDVGPAANPPPSMPQVGESTTLTTPLAGVDAMSVQEKAGTVVAVKSNSFVFAKLKDTPVGINEYDVIDADGGALLLEVREGEMGLATKAARMGTLSVVSAFDVVFRTADEAICFRVKGGGWGGGAELLDANGTRVGIIKKAKVTNNFELLDSQEQVRITTKQKMISYNQEVFKGGVQVGKIATIDKREAKELLGAGFDKVAAIRKYDFAYHLSVSTNIDTLEKVLLLGTTYCFSHISGRM